MANTPWVEQPSQTFGQTETFRNYSGPGVPAGETITMTLEGRPRLVTDSSGATVVSRDQTTELIIGGAALLLATVGGIFLWRAWQKRRDEEDEAWDDEAVETAVTTPPSAEADRLLRAIAHLDDSFESGALEEATYREQRDELKRQLAAVWEK